MAFSTRRGRPKKTEQTKDLGTRELQHKRKQMLTAEPLDLCLEKGILTEQQHWCGIHLRWLYTLRYGAPDISCHDITNTHHALVRTDDPRWRADREYEYHEVSNMLHQYRHYSRVMNLAVFHELPSFLNQALINKSRNNVALNSLLNEEHQALVNGFRALESLWCNAKNHPKRGESITANHFYAEGMEVKSFSSLVH